MPRQRVVLVGNGPNRAEGNTSWPDLLREVFSEVAGRKWRRSFGDAPYPLIYEHLLLEARRQRDWDERDLKEGIACRMRDVDGGALHAKIMQLPVSDVLTTNYDTALEDAAEPTAGKLNRGWIAERRYSLFRHRQLRSGRRLWYMHGDARVPGSIMLGYDQYSGYLQQMRLYTTTGIEFSKGHLRPLFWQGKLQSQGYSWIDLFFTADVWILGLGLDFIEMHLWWLLTFRARQQATYGGRKNRIVYLCRGTDGQGSSKHDMLEQLGVEVRSCGTARTTFPAFYDQAIAAIAKGK